MTAYSWASPVNGSWTTASDWTPPGGPQPGTGVPYVYTDTAVFATGSHHAYTVTGSGHSALLTVTGDRVTFDAFSNNDNGYGGGLMVDGGARVTVTATSTLDYFAHDLYGGGPVGVDGAHLMDQGHISGGATTVSNHGVLDVAGASAMLANVGGVSVDAGSTLKVSGGAAFYASESGQGTSEIDGRLTATGSGTTASLTTIAGTGTIRAADHAAVTVRGPVTGTVGFTVGAGASLTLDNTVAFSDSIRFIGPGASLTLAPDGPANTYPSSAYGMDAAINGFDATDSLLLNGVPVTSVAYAAGHGGHGSLTLFDGAATVGTLAIDGHYRGDTFSVTAVSATESRITVSAVPTLFAHM